MSRDHVRARLGVFICTEVILDPHYPIEEDEPLITGGVIDSFSLAQIAVFVECFLGVYIPDTDLTVEKMDTLRQMVDRVMQDPSLHA